MLRLLMEDEEDTIEVRVPEVRLTTEPPFDCKELIVD